jgi:hypothetical protein
MGMETWWVVMRTAPVSWWAAKSANRLMLALADSLIDIADVDGALAGFRKVLQDDLVYAESQHGGPPK